MPRARTPSGGGQTLRFGQISPPSAPAAPRVEITGTPLPGRKTLELLDPEAVLEEVTLGRAEPETGLRALTDQALQLGYTPNDDPGQILAYRQTIEPTQEVRPPRGRRAEPGVREVQLETILQSFSKGDSDDQGALLITTVRAGEYTESYEALLDAPGADLLRARELYVEDGELLEANSWFTAYGDCLSSRCPNCRIAPVTCWSGNWIDYVVCLLRCGGCAFGCWWCATCNCWWLCRWAAGCCNQ